MRVHQFTATLSSRDAVGFHTLAVDDLLRELGHETELFAESIHSDLVRRALPVHQHAQRPAPDALLYQLSTGSGVAEYLMGRPEPLLLNYHNITPPEFFDPWEPQVGAELYGGRQQVVRLARRAEGGIADSQFNADELLAAGLHEVTTVPVLFEPLTVERRNPLMGGRAGGPRLLFVGRLAPNKAQHDLIATLAVLRRSRPDAELVLVGGSSSARYQNALTELADRLCPGAVQFAGSVSSAELIDHYRQADLFLSMSAHEGFGVPLVEALGAGVPVVARDAGAVAETLGSAGVLLDGNDPVVAAAMITRVLDDQSLRQGLIDHGVQRAADFALPRTRAAMAEALSTLLEPLGNAS